MAVVSALRTKALDRVFGGGAGGFVAAAVVSWLIDQARDAGRKQPERLDTARLVPGETYLVTTRRPMSRSEAKLARSHARASAQLAKAVRPRRGVRVVARRLSAHQRRADNAAPGSRRRSREAQRAGRLEARYVRLTTPSDRERQLRAVVDEMAAELESYRLAATNSSTRPRRARTQVFR